MAQVTTLTVTRGKRNGLGLEVNEDNRIRYTWRPSRGFQKWKGIDAIFVEQPMGSSERTRIRELVRDMAGKGDDELAAFCDRHSKRFF